MLGPAGGFARTRRAVSSVVHCSVPVCHSATTLSGYDCVTGAGDVQPGACSRLPAWLPWTVAAAGVGIALPGGRPAAHHSPPC